MSVDKQFDIALASLQSIYTNYLNNFWTALASMLLVIGWLLTSEKAREFLAINRYAKGTGFIVLFVCLLGHIRIAFIFYKASQEKMGLLGKVLSPIYYDNYEITLDRFIINLGIIHVLFLLTIMLLYHLKPTDYQ